MKRRARVPRSGAPRSADQVRLALLACFGTGVVIVSGDEAMFCRCPAIPEYVYRHWRAGPSCGAISQGLLENLGVQCPVAVFVCRRGCWGAGALYA